MTLKGVVSYKDILNTVAIRLTGWQCSDKRIHHHSLQSVIPFSGIDKALGCVCIRLADHMPSRVFYSRIKMMIHHLLIAVITVACAQDDPMPESFEY